MIDFESDDFKAFAAAERPREAAWLHVSLDGPQPQKPHLREATDGDLRVIEGRIAQRWMRELEDREKRANDWYSAMQEALPHRAYMAAFEANTSTPAIVGIRAWMDERRRTRTDEGGGRPIAVLAGGVGRGKTVAACWFALNWNPTWSVPPRFVTAAAFARSSKFGPERVEVLDAGSMIFDDLGSEYADAKGSFAADFDELLDAFYSSSRALVITTNLTLKQVTERYGARVEDRLREAARWIPCTGPSLRGAR